MSPLKKSVTASIAFTIALIFAALIVKYFIFFFLPTNYWFHYESVTPVRTDVPLGKAPIFFFSDAEFKKSIEVNWLDILYCRVDSMGGDFGHFSLYESETKKMEISTKKDQYWAYHGATPTEPATCYLESQIFVEPLPGIVKIQVYKGNRKGKTIRFE